MSLPTYKQLQTKHAGYDRKKWDEAHALHSGGEAFAKLIKTFLPINPFEEVGLYEDRCKLGRHAYENHIGGIVKTLENMLFAEGFSVAPKNVAQDSLDPYWVEFKENCDGAGTDLAQVARAAFIDSLVYGRAGVILELPLRDAPALNRAEWVERGDGRGTLTPVAIHDVWNFGHDENGRLAFLTVHQCHTVQADPFSPAELVETWRVYQGETLRVYRLAYPEDKVPDGKTEVPLVWEGPHGFPSIPYVGIVLPPSLCVLESAGSLARKQFDLSFGLYYALKRTNYPVPIFKASEPPKVNRDIGHALWIGTEESFEFMMPPSEGFSVQLDTVRNVTQDLYRTCNVLAMAADNNTSSADRRSGASKDTDISALEQNLKHYGEIVRAFLESIYRLMSAARGEFHEWDIVGLDRFSLQVRGTSVEELTTLISANLGSPTLELEAKVFLAEKLLPSLEQGKKNKIRAELESAQRNGETTPPVEASASQSETHSAEEISANEEGDSE